MQRVSYYDNQYGRIYQREQLHNGHWVIVGECSMDRELIELKVTLHNLKIGLCQPSKS